MTTAWRIRFTWVFAVLFGFVSAMGEGLHLLPGQGHDPCCDCDDDCCELACSVQLPLLTQPLPAKISIEASNALGPAECDGHCCAICQFVGQALWFNHQPIILDWRFLPRFQPQTREIKLVCRVEHLLFQSRAPPLSAAC